MLFLRGELNKRDQNLAKEREERAKALELKAEQLKEVCIIILLLDR